MTSVHQLVPSVIPGDATTGHTLQVQRALRDDGFDSEIYALAVHPTLEARVHLADRLLGPSRPEGHLLYQFSAVSELADGLYARRERVALNFHNVTPPRFFRHWEPSMAMEMTAGLVQLAQLARLDPYGICVSDFNAEDLRRHGVRRTTVVPVLVDLTEFDAEPDTGTAETLSARRSGRGSKGGASWLFVGALVPHKAQHELLQALAVTRAVYDPGARLSLVGRAVSPHYAAALHRYAASLGLADAVDIAGGVTHEQLVAYYRDADVYVSLSRHEGFCVPVVEAMYHEVPVVARAAGAVPSTLGGAGVVLQESGPHDVAAAVARVVADGRLQTALGQAGRHRAREFALERTRPAMAGAVRAWVESDEHEVAVVPA